MKRISFEESKNHFSLSEDFTNAPIKFYSVIPGEDGWDNVTYYTGRKKDVYKNRGKADQWVYILSNPSHSHYKIGYTKNEPEIRAKQISTSTGVALPYKVEFGFQCFNGEALEHEVHHKLGYCRVNQHREFFDITLEEAIEVIQELGKNYI